MPGTIHVSVLGLTGSSDTSIKVSMGKIEYQTWDTGDFSFPVTNLREKLIVTLIDANGDEISNREIENRLIIERGFLEEKFQIEGRGTLHLKFQFVLNEEERDRIRFLRQSVLRKKHEKLINGNTLNPKFIDSEVLSSQDPRKMVADEQINSDRNMNLSQITKSKNNEDEEHLNKLEITEESKSIRQSISERNLSNVKKMISAFETGSNEDKKIQIPKICVDSSTNEVNKSKSQEKKVSMDKNLEEEQKRSNSLNKQRRKRTSDLDGKEEKQNKFRYTHIEDSRRLWIFPNGSKDSCITAGELGFWKKKTNSIVTENLSENHFQRGSNGDHHDHDHDHGKWKNIQKSKKQKSETFKRSIGPVEQVIRAMIMVGFASLVLLTRQ